MSNDRQGLALAFIQSHPAMAAQVLEQQPMDEVATFLIGLPQRYAALVMQHFLPLYAARIVSQIVPEQAAGLVSRLTVSQLAAMLRQTRGRVRHQLLQALPVKTRSGSRLLLQFPEDAVGAWMQTSITTVPADVTVGEALSRIRQQFSEGLAEPVLAVTRGRQVEGEVRVADLLDSREDSRLPPVLKTPPAAISGRLTLYSASRHTGWTTSDLLLVVNQKKQLVGVLPHVALRKGLRQLAHESDPGHHEDPISSLVEAFGSSALALIGTLRGMSTQSPLTGERS